MEASKYVRVCVHVCARMCARVCACGWGVGFWNEVNSF